MKQQKIEIGYLADIFEKMNEVNFKLKENKMKFIKAKRIISSFNDKLSRIGQFPSLKVCSNANGVIPEVKIQIFTDHLLQLKKDTISRFQDLLDFF